MNDGTIIPGQGWVLYGDPDTAVPDISKFDINEESTFTGWKHMGHTSKDNAPALSKEGGEKTTHDSWDVPGLRTSVAATIWGVAINALSVSKETLELAFPGGKWDGDTKSYALPAKQQVVNKALLIIMRDDVNGLASIYLPNAAIAIGEAPSISTDGFFEIQLSATGNASSTTGSPLSFFAPREKS